MLMTSCFVCATLNFGRKKSTGTEPYMQLNRVFFVRQFIHIDDPFT